MKFCRQLTLVVCASGAVLSSSIAQANFHFGVDNNKIDLHLRNLYQHDTLHDNRYLSSKELKTRQWVQALQLNYVSGLYKGVLGADVSFFGAIPLNQKNNQTPGALPLDRNEKLGSISKIGIANLRAKLGNKHLGANLRAGRMLLATPMLESNDSLALPTTFNAFYADGHYDDFSVYGVRVSKWSARNQSGFDNWYADDKGTKRIDYVTVFGGQYAHQNWMVQVDSGYSNSYLKRTHAQVGYNFEQLGSKLPGASLMVALNYNAAKSQGPLYRQTHGYDVDAQAYQVFADMKYKAFNFGLAYKRNHKDSLDYYWSHGYADKEGDYGSIADVQSRLVSDFWARGERVAQAEIGYDFTQMGMPGLATSLVYTHGSNAHNFREAGNGNATASEWERDFRVDYSFQNPELQGLSLTWKNAVYRASNKYAVNLGPEGNVDKNEFFVNYSVPLA